MKLVVVEVLLMRESEGLMKPRGTESRDVVSFSIGCKSKERDDETLGIVL